MTIKREIHVEHDAAGRPAAMHKVDISGLDRQRMRTR